MTPPLPDPNWPCFSADETEHEGNPGLGIVIGLILGGLLWAAMIGVAVVVWVL